MSPGIHIPSRTSRRDLTGSDRQRAGAILRTRWADAELVAGTAAEDGGGAIIQFHLPTAPWGKHATINIRWDADEQMFTGHYFDDGFAADVDFIYRSRRGY